MTKKPTLKHYVTFYSPGTFFSESTSKDIAEWDTDKAVKMARKIVERYGAKPYGFRFYTTKLKANKDGSKTWQESKKSKMYYIGGKILTIDDIEKRNKDGKDDILLANMRGNDWPTVIQNDNSWRTTQPFDPKNDVLLDVKL